MPETAAPSSAIDQAQARLEAALRRLETRVTAGVSPSGDGGEAARLRAQLAEAGERERRLEQVAAEASAALGRAAAEVRSALTAEV